MGELIKVKRTSRSWKTLKRQDRKLKAMQMENGKYTKKKFKKRSVETGVNVFDSTVRNLLNKIKFINSKA